MKSEQAWIESPVAYVAALQERRLEKVEKPKDLLKVFTDAFVSNVSKSDAQLDLYPGIVTDEMQQSLNHDRLCVVRGMVQDIGESELFVLSYATSGSNGSSEVEGSSKRATAFLKDNTVLAEHSVLDPQSVTYADRQSLIVTPVPAENEWVLNELIPNFVLKCRSSAEDGEYSKASKIRKCGDDANGSGIVAFVKQKGVEVKFYGDENEVAINNVYLFYGVYETVPLATKLSAEQYLMDCDFSGEFISKQSADE